MLTKDYGIPIRPKAPADRFHENLPAKLEAQTTETWYFPIEDVSKVLEWFYRPARKAIQTSEYVFLYVRCIMGTGKILYGPWFKLTTDSSAHWPSPEKLRNLAFAELFFREISKRWRYFGTLLSIVFAVIRILGILGSNFPSLGHIVGSSLSLFHIVDRKYRQLITLRYKCLCVRTGPRIAIQVLPSPSRISFVSGPAAWSAPFSSRLCLLCCRSPCRQQGRFPLPALPGFLGTTSPSATLSPVSRLSGAPGYTAYPAPPISRRGEEGFSSCLARPRHRAVATTTPECRSASASLRCAMLPSSAL